MKKILLIVLVFGFLNSFSQKFNYPFKSFYNFKHTLDSVGKVQNQTNRNLTVNALWDTLKKHHQIPFAFEDSVAFLYNGLASSVYWAGDFTGWSASEDAYKGVKIGLTNIWKVERKFPQDARLDYKIVVDNNWILDPSNSYQQMSGYGPNSELRMPQWKFSDLTVLKTGVIRGELSPNIRIHSKNLNYDVNYKVYKPYNYAATSHLPVIYVTDGQEYSDDALGAMTIILDNMIFEQTIKPVIAVFIDPRNPDNQSQNRRMTEYVLNKSYANFVADELSRKIDTTYHVDTTANHRAILGTSLGGINSAFFGVTRPDRFRLIGINSPAFSYGSDIFQLYNNSSNLPIKIIMTTGVISDTQKDALQMKSIFDQKNYPCKYIEVNEGHSWGNWRALTDDILFHFFSDNVGANIETSPDYADSQLSLTPNPASDKTIITFSLAKAEAVALEMYDLTGKLIDSVASQFYDQGVYNLHYSVTKFPTGIYFVKLKADHWSITHKLIVKH